MILLSLTYVIPHCSSSSSKQRGYPPNFYFFLLRYFLLRKLMCMNVLVSLCEHFIKELLSFTAASSYFIFVCAISEQSKQKQFFTTQSNIFIEKYVIKNVDYFCHSIHYLVGIPRNYYYITYELYKTSKYGLF